MSGATRLTIGYIPLADAAALIVAADRGFAAEEGLQIDLVREVSWSNVRDKLNIGLLDGAHLLAPLAVASSLGIGHVRVPMTVPFNLALNGNAVTVSPALWARSRTLRTGTWLSRLSRRARSPASSPCARREGCRPSPSA
jgi:NitT/TauT family transport system ATP-binding protein